MKKFLAAILSIVLIISIVPMGAFTTSATSGNTADFAGGSGTTDDPYLISTKEHLDNVRNYLSSHFKMVDDIVFDETDFAYGGDFFNNGMGWNPIGVFTGEFDGAYHTIYNLYIDTTANKIGLFSEANDATIKNINLRDVSINGGSYVGGICGYLKATNDNDTLIENCYVDGQVTAKQYAGGICGYVYALSHNTGGGAVYSHADIVHSYNDASVSAEDYAGGIAASTYSAGCSIQECVNNGAITSNGLSGGILAYQTYDSFYHWSNSNLSGFREWTTYTYSAVKNCYNVGTINGVTSGGIVGSDKTCEHSSSSGGTINCYNVGSVTGTTTDGIIAKHSKSYISSCYSLETKTEAELQKISTYINWDFNTIWTLGGDFEYKYPELQCFTLQGSIDITGPIAYEAAVATDISGLVRKPEVFEYVWYIDDVEVHKGNEYTPIASDIGKELMVKIISDDYMCMGYAVSTKYVVGKGIQKDSPINPELLALNDNSLEITTVFTQEYSLDNINWQSSGAFENLDPNKEYTVYSRILENDLYLLGESAPVLTVTTDRRPLTGNVNIVGTPRFGDTLTVDISAVGPDDNVTYSYEWKRGNEVVGTDNAYTIVKEDIDKSITLSVIGADDYIGTLTSAAVTGTKASVQIPNAPVVESKTNTSIKLVEKAGLEYSKDKINWQDSTLFEGLSPNTEYTFYQRVKETETEFASKSSNGTKVATLKNTISAPANPAVKEVTNNSVTLEKISGYEYSLDGLSWQNSNVFSNLFPNTEYSFCQRIAETETDYASAQSGYVNTVTLKNTVSAPMAPVVESATDASVTLVAIDGYEYSKNGTTWQKSNVFTSLEPLETYTFYQRIAETETDYASEKGEGTSFKVKFIASKPATPVLVEVTNDKIVVETKEGYQYSIDGVNWRRQGTFTGLNPNATYAVYCRMPENDEYYTSANSKPLNVTTLKNTVNTPGAPILSAKTDVSVTLVAIEGYEYSRDGETWQASNVFVELSPDTEYTFYQRIAETETDYASEKSAGTTVVTYKKCEIHPEYHIYTSDCDTDCNACGFIREVADHKYDNACDDTCNVVGCGATRTVGEHKYDNACDKSCNICGATRTVGEHKYDNACDKTCNICGATRTVGAHKYSNSCDTSCNICGATRSITHSYKTTTTKATTSKNGSVVTKCSVCGKVASNTAIKYAKMFMLSTTSYTYDGKVKAPTVTVKDSAGKTLKKNTDYTVTYASGRKSVGTYKVTVKLKGNYSGTKTLSFKINPAPVSKCSLKLSTTSYSYNGKAKTPSVVVKNSSGTTLKKNTHYTVTYASGRKNVGTYKVTVKMKGSYTGTKTLTFTIKPTTKTSANLLVGATTSIGAKSNKSISYTTSNKSVATVSSKGVITAKKAGTATVSVKSNGVTQKIKVTVKTPYVKVSGTSSMLLKKSVTLKATTNTGAKVKWSSSNTKIATVSSSGKVTGQKAGSATIYAKVTYKGKTYTCKYSVTVKKPYLTKTSATIDKGKTCQISVNGGSGTVTYTSSNKSVATVSSKGVVKALKKGTATITVKRNGYSMKFTVKVNVNSDKEILAAYAEFVLKNVALKNPSTYKVNNYIYKKNGTSYTAYVWYSAANGFGGMKDGWAMAQFDTEKSVIAYSVKYGSKYVNVYTGWSRPSTFDGYIDADAVEEEYDKIGTINYYSPSI